MRRTHTNFVVFPAFSELRIFVELVLLESSLGLQVISELAMGKVSVPDSNSKAPPGDFRQGGKAGENVSFPDLEARDSEDVAFALLRTELLIIMGTTLFSPCTYPPVS